MFEVRKISAQPYANIQFPRLIPRKRKQIWFFGPETLTTGNFIVSWAMIMYSISFESPDCRLIAVFWIKRMRAISRYVFSAQNTPVYILRVTSSSGIATHRSLALDSAVVWKISKRHFFKVIKNSSHEVTQIGLKPHQNFFSNFFQQIWSLVEGIFDNLKKMAFWNFSNESFIQSQSSMAKLSCIQTGKIGNAIFPGSSKGKIYLPYANKGHRHNSRIIF